MSCKWLSGLSLISCLAVFGALGSAHTANALSDYDYSYVKTGSMVVGIEDNYYTNDPNARCDDVDITKTFASYLEPAQLSSFNNAIANNGSWGVTQYKVDDMIGTGGKRKEVRVYWTDTANKDIVWGTGGVSVQNVNEVTIGCQWYNNGKPIKQLSYSANTTAIISKPINFYENVENVYWTGNTNYPEGYEGTPITKNLVSFDSLIRYDIKDKLGQFWLIDKPEGAKSCKLYIDDNPAVEPDDAIEEDVLEWVKCGTESPITKGWDEHGTYYVRLQIEQADGSIDQFTKTFLIDGRSYSGEFDSNGDVGSGEVVSEDPRNMMANCFKETFPFIDLGGCLDNMGKIVNILSFNTINFTGRMTATPCRNLTVIDDWLHLNSPTVCPQVPENVRSVVTPFVMCAVGLMTVAFITRQTRERF